MSLIARLEPALADRYRIERELGSGGMATDPRMNSLLGSAWLRHARRASREDVAKRRCAEPRLEPREEGGT